MSGEFGEDFKPAKGADLGKGEAETSAFHQELHNDRATAKGADNTKADDKADKAHETGAHAEKAAFHEGSGKSYSDWCAENLSPKENYEALEKSLNAALLKMATLAKAGMGDVVEGGSYLAGLVKDGTPSEITNFLDTIKKHVEK